MHSELAVGGSPGLVFPRSWVQIPESYTGWTFFTFVCYKFFIDVCLKKRK